MHLQWTGQSEWEGANWLLSFQTFFAGDAPTNEISVALPKLLCTAEDPVVPDHHTQQYRLMKEKMLWSGVSSGVTVI
jgi:hypothetical protein